MERGERENGEGEGGVERGEIMDRGGEERMEGGNEERMSQSGERESVKIPSTCTFNHQILRSLMMSSPCIVLSGFLLTLLVS